MKKKRTALIVVAAVAVVGVAMVVAINLSVSHWSQGRCYSNTDEIPHRRVGLLLGTSPVTRSGGWNGYFYYRTEACAELYRSGKITHVLISGDNGTMDYNEPNDMRKELVALGVPFDSITLDYAGFSTYASMVRARKVFGQDSLTVISQPWHNERALYIAHHIGIDAIAYNANDVSVPGTALKLRVREWLARTKMAILLLFQPDPVLGPEENL